MTDNKKHHEATPALGNHALPGFPSVATEADRAAVNVAAAPTVGNPGVGGVIRQTAGARPGYYIAIATGVGLAKWMRIDGPELVLSPDIKAANFNAEAGVIYRWNQAATLAAMLPATPPDDTLIGFVGVPGATGGNLTLNANGGNFLGVAATLKAPKWPDGAVLVICRYSAADTTWLFDSAFTEMILANFPNSIIASDTNGDLGLETLAEGELVGRLPGEGIAPLGGPQALRIVEAGQALDGSEAEIAYDVDDGANAEVELSQAGHTLAFTNTHPWQRGRLKVEQDGTGGRTITTYTVAGGVVRFPLGAPPVLSAGTGAIDYLEWWRDSGTDLYIRNAGSAWA